VNVVSASGDEETSSEEESDEVGSQISDKSPSQTEATSQTEPKTSKTKGRVNKRPKMCMAVEWGPFKVELIEIMSA
jgi:hypothetical protein